MKKVLKQKKGITLIALVITIIVLLILAGISIAMLSGDNSILQKGTEAREKTGTAQTEEKIKLAYAAGLTNGNGSIDKASLLTELQKEFGADKVTEENIVESADGKKWTVTIDGATVELAAGSTTVAQNPQEPETPALPTGAGTKPYLPSEAFHQLPETTLENGLVITDAADPADTTNPGNEYVWIEVPNANLGGETPTFGPDYTTQGLTVAKIEDEPITDDQKTKIETALINYVTTDLLNGSDYKTGRQGRKDEWYDTNGKNATSGGTTTDAGGCGLTETAYNTLYKNMLKSVYNNGGFWIGRYESGTGTARGNKTDSIEGLIPLSKVNSYPINYVTCSQAQTIASSVLNKGSYNSSLMFGIQWDCVLKYLNKRGSVSVADLTSNSSSWGNYYNQQFEINRGKYSQASPWNVYIDYTTATANKVKVEGEVSTKIGTTSSNRILLTTGAVDVNRKQNIYDLAGNVYEWTLENTSSANSPCAYRGGDFNLTGSGRPASGRNSNSTSSSYFYGRFSCFTLLIRSTVHC